MCSELEPIVNFCLNTGIHWEKLFCELKVGELVDQSVNLMYPDKTETGSQSLVNPKLQEKPSALQGEQERTSSSSKTKI